jgi:hypothetical protein
MIIGHDLEVLRKKLKGSFLAIFGSSTFRPQNFRQEAYVWTWESFYALVLRVIARNFGCNANYRATTRYGILKV